MVIFGLAENHAFSCHPFVDAESELLRNQTNWPRATQVVELRACLASDRDRILKPRGRDESDPGTLSLQHCIGANRRAMTKLQVLKLADAPETLQNCFRWIV
jgi:hypothetical protein